MDSIEQIKNAIVFLEKQIDDLADCLDSMSIVDENDKQWFSYYEEFWSILTMAVDVFEDRVKLLNGSFSENMTNEAAINVLEKRKKKNVEIIDKLCRHPSTQRKQSEEELENIAINYVIDVLRKRMNLNALVNWERTKLENRERKIDKLTKENKQLKEKIDEMKGSK